MKINSDFALKFKLSENVGLATKTSDLAANTTSDLTSIQEELSMQITGQEARMRTLSDSYAYFESSLEKQPTKFRFQDQETWHDEKTYATILSYGHFIKDRDLQAFSLVDYWINVYGLATAYLLNTIVHLFVSELFNKFSTKSEIQQNASAAFVFLWLTWMFVFILSLMLFIFFVRATNGIDRFIYKEKYDNDGSEAVIERLAKEIAMTDSKELETMSDDKTTNISFVEVQRQDSKVL